jgi:succinate-semialdehyde dehydrogenase
MSNQSQIIQEAAESRNPANGELIERFEFQSKDEIETVLTAALDGFQRWRRTPMDERVVVLRRMAEVLRANSQLFAETITREMGKILQESKAEIEKCAKECEWYAEHGPKMIADEPAPIDGSTAYISYLPIGPILAIMPWNFPFWQPMRAAVPILLGGNTVVLKPAPNVMRCGLNLELAWKGSGLPDGVFTVLNAANEHMEQAIGDRRIAAVTVTGSPRAGSAVAAAAGRALKKSVLELGGSDPFIVLADADLDRAVDQGIKARFSNAGQVCICAKRFILEEPIANEFTQRFAEAVRELEVGDPMDRATRLGPIARDDLREALDRQVQSTVADGAKLLTGGHKLSGKGFFYAPTVLQDVQPGMSAFDEETFGPVAAMTVARDAEHAIELANNSVYGLSGNLWSRDEARARELARRLETGGVFINGFSASDPRVPIGGIKNSGYGRELSYFGLREFLNAQTVWLDRP